jgi:N-acetylglucosaminyldiphosphoundecaprenol N-acetyl-beta-D-mannosaminyltransferase
VKYSVLGAMVDAIDYGGATRRIIDAAERRRPFAVSALAVHGVMNSVRDPELRYRINQLDVVVPDGQPVRWALNWLHGTRLRDRVAGPRLMLEVCRAAAASDLPIYLYGRRREVLEPLAAKLMARFDGLKVAGTRPSLFRQASVAERDETQREIVSSGARAVFVGLGCPRQEVFAYENREALGIPVIAVGAAFDFHAGVIRRPGGAIQRLGLEWAYRLAQQPRKLWRRYLTQNPAYLVLIALQRVGLSKVEAAGTPPSRELGYG